ncbi:MAG: hypothetical protein AAF358_02765 [Pseudomonadota bacterium]
MTDFLSVSMLSDMSQGLCQQSIYWAETKKINQKQRLSSVRESIEQRGEKVVEG